MSEIKFENLLKDQLKKELSKIKEIDKTLLNYMKDIDNWIFVDPDGSIGGDAPLCYPMEIMALSIKKMPNNIKDIIGKNKIKKIEEELSEQELEEIYDKDEEDLLANGFSSITASFFWDNGLISTIDLESALEANLFDLPEADNVFVFNGYELTEELLDEDEEENYFNSKCLNSNNVIDYL